MRNRLLALDIVLAAIVVVLAFQVREKWQDARKREWVVLGHALRQVPPPPYSALPSVRPLIAAAYGEVAQRNLFSADRSSTVVVEVAPPKPMPALPSLYGIMNLGDGPVAIMAASSGDRNREIRTGEKIGDFTLVALSSDQIVLEWDGKRISKKPSELLARAAAVAEAAQPERQAARPSQPPAVERKGEFGPGRDVGGGYRACDAGDTTPAGTIRDGVKKVITYMPTGASCQWVPVR